MKVTLFSSALPRAARWLLGSLSLVCGTAYAQSGVGTVTGRVLNQRTNEYLRNAQVSVVGTTLTATAEEGGNFQVLNVPAGPQTLRFSYLGLDSKDELVNVVGGQTTR